MSSRWHCGSRSICSRHHVDHHARARETHGLLDHSHPRRLDSGFLAGMTGVSFGFNWLDNTTQSPCAADLKGFAISGPRRQRGRAYTLWCRVQPSHEKKENITFRRALRLSLNPATQEILPLINKALLGYQLRGCEDNRRERPESQVDDPQ